MTGLADDCIPSCVGGCNLALFIKTDVGPPLLAKEKSHVQCRCVTIQCTYKE